MGPVGQGRKAQVFMTDTASNTLDADGFHSEDFNSARPFSGFLPGIAGAYGKPLWVFYANRGQCVASFGIGDKNGAMLEFHAANKAYTLTPLLGFRTFMRLAHSAGDVLYEPFQCPPAQATQQSLTVRPSEIAITDTNTALGLRGSEGSESNGQLCHVRITKIHVPLQALQKHRIQFSGKVPPSLTQARDGRARSPPRLHGGTKARSLLGG